MKSFLLSLAIGGQCFAGCCQPVGMNGAPWPTRPRPSEAQQAPRHIADFEYEEIDPREGAVLERPPKPCPSDKPLIYRIWGPGLVTLGLASAVAVGVYQINDKEAHPVDLNAPTVQGTLQLYSPVPLFAELYVQQEGNTVASWSGEVSGNFELPFLYKEECPLDVVIKGGKELTATLNGVPQQIN